MSGDLAHRRLARAAILVAAFVVAVPASGLAEGALSPDENTAAAAGIDAASLVGRGGPTSSLGRLEQLVDSRLGEVPRYFEEEVGLPEGASDVRASEDGAVVGCVIEGTLEDVRQAVGEHMAASGWTEVDLGANQGATYMKPSGSCTWCLATYVQVGDATSVVFRCVAS